MKTKFLLTTVLAFTGVAIFSVITGFQPKKPWVVPDKYEKMKNRLLLMPNHLKTVKNYGQGIASHAMARSGHGDGSKAAQLKTEPGNFSLPDVQKESDGSFFYKISEGREDMPSFKKKIPDEDDIWSLVNYIRTLDK